jgi:hypothetical protein
VRAHGNQKSVSKARESAAGAGGWGELFMLEKMTRALEGEGGVECALAAKRNKGCGVYATDNERSSKRGSKRGSKTLAEAFNPEPQPPLLRATANGCGRRKGVSMQPLWQRLADMQALRLKR